MRRLFVLLFVVICVLVTAMTPIKVNIEGIEAIYYEEYLALFNSELSYDDVLISSIMDGDTFTMIRHKSLNFIELLRLIGVDAPNSEDSDEKLEYFGNEAADFARSILENRKYALSYDQTPMDTYGRILAYVWVPAIFEGNEYKILFNLLLITNGYGHAYTIYPFEDKYMEIFIEAERIARIDKQGLWSSQEFASMPPEPEYNPIVYITNTGTMYHQAHCQHLLQSKIAIRLSEAVRRGYTPCNVCNPPRPILVGKETSN